MTVGQMKLENALQMCQLQAQELEIKDNKLSQIMAAIDEHIQRQDDTFINTHDSMQKKIAYYTVMAMRELRKEIESIQGQED